MALVVTALAGFTAIAVVISRDSVPGPDATVARQLPQSDELNDLGRVADAFLYGGMVLGAIFVIVVFVALILRDEWRPMFFWLLAFAGVVVLDVGLKAAFERPSLDHDSQAYSFPSGNAMASMALLLAVRALLPPGNLNRALSVIGAAIVLLYSTALVYLSWHYPSDVVAGWCISLAWVTFLGLVIRPRPALDPGGQPQGSFSA